MTEQIVCVVFGHPQGKGSKRAFPINRAGGSQSIVLVDSNRNAKPWQTRVTETLRAKYDGPLLRDAEYFCSELIRRLEALQRREGDGRRRSAWQLAAKLSRRIRAELRIAIDADRAKRRRAALR